MKKGEMPAIFFISDLHIGLHDEKIEQLKMDNIERLFAIIKAEGRSLYMLGDIFDYWMEFRHLIPKGFTRFLCLLSDLVRHNIEIVYVAGNHDFNLGRYFDDELGIKTLYGTNELLYDGHKFIFAHGDGLGPGDIGYKLFARLVRNRFNLSLLSGFHPDLAISLMKMLGPAVSDHRPMSYPRNEIPRRPPAVDDRIVRSFGAQLHQSLMPDIIHDGFYLGRHHMR